MTTFRHPSGAYICQTPGHTLSRLAKGTPSESRLFRRYHWFGVKLFAVGCVQDSPRVLQKREKCCFWIWLRPRYKIPEFFTIAPVLTSTLTVCRQNHGDPSSL